MPCRYNYMSFCPDCVVFAQTIPQYNATPEFEREKLDGVLTRALLHAKVGQAMLGPSMQEYDTSHFGKALN